VDVANDGDVLKLIELLQDANVLSFTDMSFLEQFLSSIRRHDLMEQLKLAELRIAVDVVLEAFSRATSLSEDVCDLSLHGDIITFLVATRERSHELISQVVGELKQADSDLEIVGILGEVLEECQQWSTVTALLAIVGELFPTISDSEKQVYVTVFAGLIHKLGGLRAFEVFIRKKRKVTSNGCALSAVEESVKENIKLIGHQVDDMQSST